MRPYAIEKRLKLRNPIYSETASYGHLGRTPVIVKKEFMKIIHNINLKEINWIPSHPIAGTEESGPKAGDADIFENRWCIISPPKVIAEQTIKILKSFSIILNY